MLSPGPGKEEEKKRTHILGFSVQLTRTLCPRLMTKFGGEDENCERMRKARGKGEKGREKNADKTGERKDK